ncbi:hypothetical protein HK1_01361 [Tepidibacillus sp. HK-1]|nr:hypothetical protein HK1_01361 [Tepidibacillus sp. HK-1]
MRVVKRGGESPSFFTICHVSEYDNVVSLEKWGKKHDIYVL